MHRDRRRHQVHDSRHGNGTYTNSTHILEASGGNLHIWNVSTGCLGLAHNGDPATLKGSVTITPGQTITSP